MSTSELMKLVKHGARDLDLTANPTITFYKIKYRAFTNFVYCYEKDLHHKIISNKRLKILYKIYVIKRIIIEIKDGEYVDSYGDTFDDLKLTQSQLKEFSTLYNYHSKPTI
jgi:hypothetical protein